MEKKRSKPSGAQFRKKRKEEEEKRAKDKGMQLCSLSLYDYSIHFMNEGLMLIGGGYNSLLAFLL